MTDFPHAHSETLLTHMAWVRRLALHLARDPHVADDLVQATCLAALEHPPIHRANVRGWLNKIVVNAFRQFRRHDTRFRRTTTRAGAVAEPIPPDELLDRAQVQQQVARAALALPEHYRTVILLRYFEDLTPTEIAARQQLPLNTVKSRLTRALHHLRRELDETHGRDRNRWLVAILPLTPMSTAVMKFKLAASAALCVIAIPLVWSKISTTHDAALASDAIAENRTDLVASGQRLAPSAEGTRVGVEDPNTLLAFLTDIPPTARVRGLVLGTDGKPRAAVVVTSGEGILGATATSDRDGVFQIEGTSRLSSVRAKSRDLLTIVAGEISSSGPASRSGTPTVVVADACDVRGTVESEDGTRLHAAKAVYLLPADFRTRFERVLDYTLIHRFPPMETDRTGRFLLKRCAIAKGGRVRVSCPGFISSFVELPRANEPIRIVLRRVGPNDGMITGLVLDADGYPVSAANVFHGATRSRSDGAGRFALEFKGEPSQYRIFALKKGYLPGRISPATLSAGDHVELRLGGKPGILHGIVVDEKGRPCRNFFAWPRAATTCGVIDGRLATVEGLLGGTVATGWAYRFTDAEGRFDIGGLFQRDYTLAIMDPVSQQIVEAGPHRPGSGPLRIVFPSDGTIARVAGRVVSTSGKPVPGVTVATCRSTATMRVGSVRAISRNCNNSTLTDKDGRFEFGVTAREGVYVLVSGNGVMTTRYGDRERGVTAVADRDIEDLIIVVHLKMQLRVEAPKEFADSFTVFDGAGTRLPMLHVEWKDKIQERKLFRLVRGKSPEVTVADSAQTIVFYRKGAEVARRRLQLLSGQMNIIRP